eukprot:611265-Amphidinium_carterae.1
MSKSVQDIANTVWAFAVLQQTRQEVFQARLFYSNEWRDMQTISLETPWGMLCSNDKAFSGRILLVASEFTPHGLASTTWAVAKVDYKDERLLHGIAQSL